MISIDQVINSLDVFEVTSFVVNKGLLCLITLNLYQVCDGNFDCPKTETSNEGEEEDDCDYGESRNLYSLASKATTQYEFANPTKLKIFVHP